MRVVTSTGNIKTCKKYILVTVWPESVVPANSAFAIQSPIKGVAVAIAKFDHLSRQRRRDPIVIQEIGLRHRPRRARCCPSHARFPALWPARTSR